MRGWFRKSSGVAGRPDGEEGQMIHGGDASVSASMLLRWVFRRGTWLPAPDSTSERLDMHNGSSMILAFGSLLALLSGTSRAVQDTAQQPTWANGGYAHLISACAQWLLALEGKSDWEMHQVPAVSAP